MEMGNLIEVRNLSKCYGDKKVLHQLNFSVQHGEIFTILGPSGVGKSTLLRMLSQLENYEEGHIEYDPLVFEHPVPFPVVFQETSQLLPWLTVKENILLGVRNESILKALALDLDILDVLNHYPHMLSGGMKQRVAIGRGVMCQSEILFMDEPFSSLDFSIREKLQKLVLNLRDSYKQSIIFITHDISEALTISDRILILGHHKYRLLENTQDLKPSDIKNVIGEMTKESE